MTALFVKNMQRIYGSDAKEKYRRDRHFENSMFLVHKMLTSKVHKERVFMIVNMRTGVVLSSANWERTLDFIKGTKIRNVHFNFKLPRRIWIYNRPEGQII